MQLHCERCSTPRWPSGSARDSSTRSSSDGSRFASQPVRHVRAHPTHVGASPAASTTRIGPAVGDPCGPLRAVASLLCSPGLRSESRPLYPGTESPKYLRYPSPSGGARSGGGTCQFQQEGRPLRNALAHSPRTQVIVRKSGPSFRPLKSVRTLATYAPR